MNKTIITIILFFILFCTKAVSQVTVISEQSVCVDSATIQAPPLQAGETGIWTATSIPERNKYIQHPDKNVTVVNELFYGENHFTWTVTKGDEKTEYFVRVTNNSVRNVTYAGEYWYNNFLNGTIQLNAKFLNPERYLYRWSVTAGQGEFSDPSIPFPKITNPAPGVNIYRWTVKDIISGCEAYDDVIVEVNDNPKHIWAGKFSCEENFELNADESLQGSGFWEIITGAGELEDSYSYKTTVNNMSDGINTFLWTIVLYGQENSSEVNVVKGYSIDAGPDIELCDDRCSLSVDIILPEGSGFINKNKASYSWDVISGSGIITYNTTDSSVISASNLQPGENTFRVSSKLLGCNSSDTITVTYNQPEVAFDIVKADTCPVPMVELLAQADIMDSSEINYYWSFGDGEHNFCGGEHVTHNYKAKTIDTTYTIRLIAQNENGCEAFTELEHEVKACTSSSVNMLDPKITFSPNPVITDLHINQVQGETNIQSIKVYGMDGTCVKSLLAPPLSSSLTVPMGNLPQGLYVVHVQMGNTIILKKIIKMKSN